MCKRETTNIKTFVGEPVPAPPDMSFNSSCNLEAFGL